MANEDPRAPWDLPAWMLLGAKRPAANARPVEWTRFVRSLVRRGLLAYMVAALIMVSDGVSQHSLMLLVGALVFGLLYVVYLEILVRRHER